MFWPPLLCCCGVAVMAVVRLTAVSSGPPPSRSICFITTAGCPCALEFQSLRNKNKERRDQMETSECDVCGGGALWVCEDHPNKPWDGASDREDACHCGGAGMPCLVCNRTIGQEPPEMPPGYRTMIDTDGPKH